MSTNTMSYTRDILDTMMQSMLAEREYKGFRKLANGLIEDCAGQVFTVDLKQSKDSDDVYHVKLYLRPVNVASEGV